MIIVAYAHPFAYSLDFHLVMNLVIGTLLCIPSQGLRRIGVTGVLRGVFDGAMRVYLSRFLNVPPVPLPKPKKMQNSLKGHEMLLNELLSLLDKQQQVESTGRLVLDYLYNNGKPDRLLSTIGKVLLREDRNFHSIQMLEAASIDNILLCLLLIVRITIIIAQQGHTY